MLNAEWLECYLEKKKNKQWQFARISRELLIKSLQPLTQHRILRQNQVCESEEKKKILSIGLIVWFYFWIVYHCIKSTKTPAHMNANANIQPEVLQAFHSLLCP